MNEPKAMREIHEIRERISYETAGLSPEERSQRVNRAAENLLKQYGIELKTVSCSNEKSKTKLVV